MPFNNINSQALAQQLISPRTIGDWSQQYRPLLNSPGGPSAPGAAALSQVLGGGIASGGIYGGGREGGDQREPGYDPNQGAGTSDLSLWEGAKKFAPYALAVAGGPAGMLGFGIKQIVKSVLNAGDQAAGGLDYERAIEADEAFQGEAMRQFEQDSGGGSTDRSYSGGDYAGSTGFDRGGDSDRDGGDFGRGNDPGGGAAGSPFHKGGPITDRNPKTYRDNMRITAQEGEFVMSREAVGLLGRDFLNRANRVARDRK